MLFDFSITKNSPTVKNYNWLGYAASIIGLLSFIPLLWVVYNTGITKNFPYSALILTVIGWSLMAIYGYLSKTTPSMILGLVYLGIFSYILYVKIISPQNLG